MKAYDTLDQLTAPQRVAIVGASDNPTRIGGRPISYMLNHGFTGQIFPVNPKNETIQGLPAYARIGDIPEEIDFALIAVKSTMVADQVRAAAKKVHVPPLSFLPALQKWMIADVPCNRNWFR